MFKVSMMTVRTNFEVRPRVGSHGKVPQCNTLAFDKSMAVAMTMAEQAKKAVESAVSWVERL